MMQTRRGANQHKKTTITDEKNKGHTTFDLSIIARTSIMKLAEGFTILCLLCSSSFAWLAQQPSALVPPWQNHVELAKRAGQSVASSARRTATTLESPNRIVCPASRSKEIQDEYSSTQEDKIPEQTRRRRKNNKYAKFSKVQEESDPFEELLAESLQKQAAIERDMQEAKKLKRKQSQQEVKLEPLVKIQFPDNKEINPYDPATFGYIEIGHVTGAHGVHGWIKVTCTTDFPVERLCTAGIRHLKPYNKRAPRQITLVQGKHRLEDEYLIQLQEVEDRDAAAKFRGATLYVRQEEKVLPQVKTDDDQTEYLVSDLVHMDVYDQQTNNLVGKVAGVVLAEDMCSLPGLGQDLLEVTLQKGAMASWRDELVLIPFVPQIVPTVNASERQIFIDPPSGLLDLTYFREERVRLKGFLPPSWDGEDKVEDEPDE